MMLITKAGYATAYHWKKTLVHSANSWPGLMQTWDPSLHLVPESFAKIKPVDLFAATWNGAHINNKVIACVEVIKYDIEDEHIV
jgi:hypothetical protein